MFDRPMLPRAARALLPDLYTLPRKERCQSAAVLEARADLWRSTPLDQAVRPVNVRVVPKTIDLGEYVAEDIGEARHRAPDSGMPGRLWGRLWDANKKKAARRRLRSGYYFDFSWYFLASPRGFEPRYSP